MAGKVTSKLAGWLKALLGAAAGLVSGAVMMYLTPWVEKAVKPAKPVANFSKEAAGLTVTLHNRSSGAQQGWWDFGDGSALEPFAPQQELVPHTYAAPGDYTVKLTVRNLIGDESERTVQVRLDAGQAAAPEVQGFDLVPVSPGSYAPATFRLTAKLKNAQVCVWDLGDDRPLEVLTEGVASQDRLVTFARPGGYVVKLAAVNGTKVVEKTEIANVVAPPLGTVTAVLRVADQGTQVQTVPQPGKLTAAFPPDQRDPVFRFDKALFAQQGFEIAEVRLPVHGDQGPRLRPGAELPVEPGLVGAVGARNLRLQLTPDRRAVRLTGELVWEAGQRKGNATLPQVVVPVVLVQERRLPAQRPPVAVSAAVNVPGSATVLLPPPPADWVNPQRQLQLQLVDGGKVVWQDTQVPRGALVTVRGRNCILTTAAQGDQIRLDLVELPLGLAQARPPG